MRYFTVFYTGIKDGVRNGYGFLGCNRPDYPSHEYLIRWIKNNVGYKDVVLTNIIEMDEKDFHDFHGGE